MHLFISNGTLEWIANFRSIGSTYDVTFEDRLKTVFSHGEHDSLNNRLPGYYVFRLLVSISFLVQFIFKLYVNLSYFVLCIFI